MMTSPMPQPKPHLFILKCKPRKIAEAVKGFLICGLHAKQDEPEASLAHQDIVFVAKPAEAHVAVDADFPS